MNRPQELDRHDHALALIARARAAGISLRNERRGLMVCPVCELGPELGRDLSIAYYEVRAALRAEKAAERVIRRAARSAPTVQRGHALA
jgi:hypothetical protein